MNIPTAASSKIITSPQGRRSKTSKHQAAGPREDEAPDPTGYNRSPNPIKHPIDIAGVYQRIFAPRRRHRRSEVKSDPEAQAEDCWPPRAQMDPPLKTINTRGCLRPREAAHLGAYVHSFSKCISISGKMVAKFRKKVEEPAASSRWQEDRGTSRPPSIDKTVDCVLPGLAGAPVEGTAEDHRAQRWVGGGCWQG